MIGVCAKWRVESILVSYSPNFPGVERMRCLDAKFYMPSTCVSSFFFVVFFVFFVLFSSTAVELQYSSSTYVVKVREVLTRLANFLASSESSLIGAGI